MESLATTEYILVCLKAISLPYSIDANLNVIMRQQFANEAASAADNDRLMCHSIGQTALQNCSSATFSTTTRTMREKKEKTLEM